MFIELTEPITGKKYVVNANDISCLQERVVPEYDIADSNCIEGTILFMISDASDRRWQSAKESYSTVKEILGFVRDNVWSTD